jgi:hypothetical protein
MIQRSDEMRLICSFADNIFMGAVEADDMSILLNLLARFGFTGCAKEPTMDTAWMKQLSGRNCLLLSNSDTVRNPNNVYRYARNGTSRQAWRDSDWNSFKLAFWHYANINRGQQNGLQTPSY